MWAVYVKDSKGAPWRDTGIVETMEHVSACVIWAQITRELGRHAFKLVAKG
jgi:hypothetical protein